MVSVLESPYTGRHVPPTSKHVKFIRCQSHKICCIYCNEFKIPTGHKISTLKLYLYPMVPRVQLAVFHFTSYSFHSLTLTLGGKRRNGKSRRRFFCFQFAGFHFAEFQFAEFHGTSGQGWGQGYGQFYIYDQVIEARLQFNGRTDCAVRLGSVLVK